jgi:hypothetical protein
LADTYLEVLVEGAVRSHKISSSYPIERRSQTIAGKLLRTQRAIESEIRNNGGTYPHNGGQLDERELCRRADITDALVQSPAHASTTRLQLARWLRKVNALREQSAARGDGDGNASALRDHVGNRTGEWKAMLEQIAISYDTANAEVATLRERVKALKEREDAMAQKQADFNATFGCHKTGREHTG